MIMGRCTIGTEVNVMSGFDNDVVQFEKVRIIANGFAQFEYTDMLSPYVIVQLNGSHNVAGSNGQCNVTTLVVHPDNVTLYTGRK